MTSDTWHATRDMWHVTHDMWHVACDMFGGVNILSKFQLPSSYRLWFMILWRSGGKGWITELINEWMNDKAVYRTAPATPGLFNIMTFCVIYILKFHLPSSHGIWHRPKDIIGLKYYFLKQNLYLNLLGLLLVVNST